MLNGGAHAAFLVARGNHNGKQPDGLLRLRTPRRLHGALVSSQPGWLSACCAISSNTRSIGTSIRQPKSRWASLESMITHGMSYGRGRVSALGAWAPNRASHQAFKRASEIALARPPPTL